MSSDLAAELADIQRARFDRLWATLTARQRRIVAKSLDALEQDLDKTRRGSWSAASSSATLVQLAQSIKGLSTKQLASLRRALPGVAAQAQDSTAKWLQLLDKSFSGSTVPLRWDSLEWLDDYRDPLLRSRLRIYRKSFARYGADAVSSIEDAVAQRVLVGTPWTDAREEVMSIVRDEVGGRQWMVDRIVRTESSVVANSTTMAALAAEDDDPDDPMMKKLVATFDAVTGQDSQLLHGQTRRLSEPFVDVTTGREYAAPPNRPNDREIVVGWRRSWGDDREFDQETAEPVPEADEVMTQAELGEAVAAPDDPVRNEVERRWESMPPSESMERYRELLAQRPKMSKYSHAEYRELDKWSEEISPYQTRVQAEYKTVRDDVIAEQTERAGESGIFETDAEAIRAMNERGIRWDAGEMPTGFARMVDAELRMLESIPFAPEVTEIVTEDRRGGVALAQAVKRKPPHPNGIRLSFDPAGIPSASKALSDDILDVASGRQPYLSAARIGAGQRRAIARRYAGISDDPVIVSHLIRHEFSHGIDFNLRSFDNRLNEDAALMRRAWIQWGDLAFRSGDYSSVSRYAATDDKEFFAEALSLAIGDGNTDALPKSLRPVVEAILGWNDLPEYLARWLLEHGPEL